MRQCGASSDDLLVLKTKKFILQFDSGVLVIKHWRINNYLQNDRIKETNYKEEKSRLFLKPNRSYTFDKEQGTPCIQSVYIPYTQISIDKISKDKLSIEKNSKDKEKEIVVVDNYKESHYTNSDFEEIRDCLIDNFLKKDDRIKTANERMIEKWLQVDKYSKEFIINGIEKVSLNGNVLGNFNYLDKALSGMKKDENKKPIESKTGELTDAEMELMYINARKEMGI